MNILKIKRKHTGQRGKAILLTKDLYNEPGQKTLRSLIGETTDQDFVRQRTTGKYLVVDRTFQLLDPEYFEKRYEILNTLPESIPEPEPMKSKNLKKRKK